MTVSERIKMIAWLYLVVLLFYSALTIINIPVELTCFQKVMVIVFTLAVGGLISALLYIGLVLEDSAKRRGIG